MNIPASSFFEEILLKIISPIRVITTTNTVLTIVFFILVYLMNCGFNVPRTKISKKILLTGSGSVFNLY